MVQTNMLEAKTKLSRLVRMLENHDEDVVIIARNGQPVAQLTLIPKKDDARRIGVATSPYPVDDDAFDAWDEEVVDMFGSAL